MEGTLRVWIVTCISVVMLSTLVAAISWTFVIGTSISYDLQGDVITYYSESGLSMLLDANNAEDVDGANVYKMIEANSAAITGYSISKMDGTPILELKELLNNPTSRYKVVIRGDSAQGFEVTVKQKSGGVTP